MVNYRKRIIYNQLGTKLEDLPGEISVTVVTFLVVHACCWICWTVHTVHEVYKDINLTKSSFEHECSSDCACSVAVMGKGYVSSGSDEDSEDEE